MDRRIFAKKSAVALFASTLFGASKLSFAEKRSVGNLGNGKPFKCKFAPNIYPRKEGGDKLFFKSTAGMSEVDKLSFFYDLGFRACEANNMPVRSAEIQKAMGDRLRKLGLEMGTFTSYNGMKDNYMTSNRAGEKGSSDKKFANRPAQQRSAFILWETEEVPRRRPTLFATSTRA